MPVLPLDAMDANLGNDSILDYLALTRGRTTSMASPIEFRFYLKLATIEDVANGIQPVRQMTNNGPQLYCPPVLQFRYKEKGADGSLQWSPFEEIRYIREGDVEPH